MKYAWMLLLGIVVCSPSQAGWRVTSHTRVTVMVEDTAHQLLGSKTWMESVDSLAVSRFPDPLSSWFSLELDDLYGSALFADVSLLDNVGKTVWISSNAEDPQYGLFVSALTDGVNQTLWGKVTLRANGSLVAESGTGYYESSFFAHDADQDFAGRIIGRIGLRVDEAAVAQEACDVPEPCSILALMCGIAGLAGYGLRRIR